MKKRYLIAALCAVALVCGFGYHYVFAQTPHLTVAGATSISPLIKSNATVTVKGGGSQAGLIAVNKGEVTIGASDVFTNSRALVDHPLAVDGIAVIVGSHTGVTNLTSAQLAGIFTGQYHNWQAVGGNDLPITVLDRTTGSGTRENFTTLALNGQTPQAAKRVATSNLMRRTVAATPGAIGYLASSMVRENTRVVKLNGQAPTEANITTNAYPLWAYLHLYTKGAPDYATAKQIAAWQANTAAIRAAHMIPLKAMQVARTKDGMLEDTH
ncbi:substrate-binding domain-containing protein [Lacticaseibacillus jixiensis]|uniref:substrate-binding domain-containing protein n=1 Tax=Lacticaseibacillus jixiensis TaxID=3231926 RepID=UPI0036F43501